MIADITQFDLWITVGAIAKNGAFFAGIEVFKDNESQYKIMCNMSFDTHNLAWHYARGFVHDEIKIIKAADNNHRLLDWLNSPDKIRRSLNTM